MTGTDARGGILSAASELLKNRALIEAVIAGIGAFSAANKVKNKAEDGIKSGGFDFSTVIDMLPQIMPLLGLLSGGEGGIFGATSPSADVECAVPTLADTDENDVTVHRDPEADVTDFASYDALPVSYTEVSSSAGRTEMRENLLLALRPFLSESRAAAADAIIRVNRVSGLFG